MQTPPKQTGLKLGLISLAGVMLIFAGLFLFGPGVQTPSKPTERPEITSIQDVLTDAPSQRALAALRTASPATYAQLEGEARWAIQDGAHAPQVAQLTLQALFGEFQSKALTFRSAESLQYHAIISGLASGLQQLKAEQSVWCEGDQIAEFLAQNDADLVPNLLAEFPYQSPQYDWAMDWMSLILNTARTSQLNPRQHPRPNLLDEATLQQTGLNLGSEQWALALQIAAFANSEGTSYAQMQEVISGMDVCQLGIAIETVSARLPNDVRARIWADLMPEIMVGNTPYVMWRVTDYFFIG